MKKTIIISAIALLLVVGIAKALTLIGSPQEIKELMGELQVITDEPFEVSLGGMPIASVDVVGSRTGTSTIFVDFRVTSTGGQSTSTTYPIFIGGDIDKATYNFAIGEASSTSNILFSILTSNDVECATASTTTSFNRPTVDQIRWFDAGDLLTNKVHSTSFVTATSTFAWSNPATDSGRQLFLENLNSHCLALDISSSATQLYVELATKDYN